MTLRFPALPVKGFLASAAVAALIGLGLHSLPAQAQDKAAMSDADRGAIEQIVRDYLLENPEVIVEAIQVFRQREQAAQEQRAQDAVKAHKNALLNAPGAPFVGNPKGDVTIVEFFDYRCGYCKRVTPLMQQILDSDKKLRWVFKEFPILGPDSLTASQAALAAWKIDPDKYLTFHTAMMNTAGALPEDRILKLGKEVGYDPDQLRKTMDDAAVKAEIDANHRLAETMNIRGTPAFIIGDELVPGAVDLTTLRELVAKARKGCTAPC